MPGASANKRGRGKKRGAADDNEPTESVQAEVNDEVLEGADTTAKSRRGRSKRQVDPELQDLEKEIRAETRAEQAAFEQAHEAEIANPTISQQRPAKAKAYSDKAWLRGKKQGKKREHEDSEGERAPVANAVKRGHVTKTNATPLDEAATDNLKLSATPDVIRGKEKPGAAASVSGSEPEEASEGEEAHSDAGREDDEDFGVENEPSVSKRKAEKIAQQLAQGTAKLVSGRRISRSEFNRNRLTEDDFTSAADSDYDADFLEAEDSSTTGESIGEREAAEKAQVDAEWKCHKQCASARQEFYIAHGQRRQKLKAQGAATVDQNRDQGSPRGNNHKDDRRPEPRHNKVSRALDLQGNRDHGDTSEREPVAATAPTLPADDSERFIADARKPRRKEKGKATDAEEPAQNAVSHEVKPKSGTGAHIKEPTAMDTGSISSSDEDDTVKPLTKQTWPSDTYLTYSDDRKTAAGIMSQKSAKVKSLLSEMIAHELPRALLRVNALPDKYQRTQMFLDMLVDASVRLKYADITKRLLDDTKYGHDMMKIPIDRMSSVRGPLYQVAREIAWDGYGLKEIEHDTSALKKAARVLTLDDRFISPGTLLDGKYTDFKPDLPFCAPPIIKIINVLFFGPNAEIPLADDFFTSSIQVGIESEQLEIPEAMAAFVATMAGAAIREGIDGARRPLKNGQGFLATAQDSHYAGHLNTLQRLTTMGRHKILGYMFKTAKTYHVKGQADRPTTSSFVNPATAGMNIQL
ncbi:hypothetical protein EVJ58_g7317 [Rhodofomes roseus]|uniref:DUF6532 domain-containing protein n=1 Tax=Rhodofomes roseus TaxID=34475 RepID=A0A4Y9Y694_9APHY|nr:hypothetical protein EVJ58_g7317 [Rhodofomes roseus]